MIMKIILRRNLIRVGRLRVFVLRKKITKRLANSGDQMFAFFTMINALHVLGCFFNFPAHKTNNSKTTTRDETFCSFLRTVARLFATENEEISSTSASKFSFYFQNTIL